MFYSIRIVNLLFYIIIITQKPSFNNLFIPIVFIVLFIYLTRLYMSFHDFLLYFVDLDTKHNWSHRRSFKVLLKMKNSDKRHKVTKVLRKVSYNLSLLS